MCLQQAFFGRKHHFRNISWSNTKKLSKMNIRLTLFTLLLSLISTLTYSQVGIGTNTPHSSSIVDVSASNKALLLPRLTSEQRAGISSPANGLVIFCTNCGTNGEIQVYSTNAWKNVLGNNTTTSLATLVTDAASNISYTTATSGGNITYSETSVTAKGVCWSTSQNPTTSNSKTTDGTGTGSFTSTITGLAANTTYYVRAYATNTAGTSYGSEVTFTSLPPAIASFGTTSYASVTGNAATISSTISSDNGATVNARGICWSTSSNPTISNNTQAYGSGGVGAYAITLTSLEAQTTYFVRSYATNSVGTAYSNEVSFTTTVRTLPTLITTAMSAITSTSATSGGNISNLGSTSVTAKGICYSTSPNPTIANTIVNQTGSTTGAFTSNMVSLTTNTTYYVRAYATNGSGTAYGNEISFTTPLALGADYGGGKIIYFLVSGNVGYDANVQHGLIASSVNLSNSNSTWGCNTSVTTSDNIGTGAANTAAIIASNCATANTAAKLCDNYTVTVGGITYSDWYLPSKLEMYQVWLNGRSFFTNLGDATTVRYATSSQEAGFPDYYWTLFFYTGYSGQYQDALKNTLDQYVGVRAVRSF